MIIEVCYKPEVGSQIPDLCQKLKEVVLANSLVTESGLTILSREMTGMDYSYCPVVVVFNMSKFLKHHDATMSNVRRMIEHMELPFSIALKTGFHKLIRQACHFVDRPVL